MHVLHELVCGIRGAELGTVDIYARGTSTRVTYYTSFEGDGSTTPTSATTLDANGGGEFYVNETCDVVVRDSGGTEIRRFTSAPAASAVEVISQSFTGTDYDSGASAVSKPTTLSAVLDLWATNAGAPDWKVDVGGVDTTMADAFASVGAAFFNVKAVTYGAIGDGVTDDTAAIQEALDAAETAGGGTVFFPKGTYSTTAPLTVAAGVSLQGVGPAASIIKSASATADVVDMEADLTSFTSITGLRITYSVSSTGDIIDCDAGRLLRIDNCKLGQTAGLNGAIDAVKYDTAGTIIFIINTAFTLDGNGGAAVKATTTTIAASVHIWNCTVVYNGVNHGTTVFVLSCGTILGSLVTCTGLTGGSTIASFGKVTAGHVQAFAFNTVTNPTSGTVTAPTGINDADPLYTQFVEFGNKYGTSIVLARAGGVAAKSTYFGQVPHHGQGGHSYELTNAATATVEPSWYAVAEIERTNTDPQTVSLVRPLSSVADFGGYNGQEFTLVYNNLNHGSVTGTITMGVQTNIRGLTTFTVNANRWSVYFFRHLHIDGVGYWCLVGSLVNQI